MVALVGAGPGDCGLLTLKAAELIRKADCIIYDRLIGDEILDIAREDCDLIYVGKENHNHTLVQDDINRLIYKKSCEHNLVVRLKGGDPYVFGRGGEEALFLKQHDAEFVVVPGISSAIAALTYAGIPITHRGVSKGFKVYTAHGKNDAMSDIDFEHLTEEDATCVFLMGLSHVSEIAKRLIDVGRNPETPIAVISNATRANQKKCVGRLDNISYLIKQANITSPAIIVVGNVVSLESGLSFFENKPLFGKSIAVPFIQNGEFDFAKGYTYNSSNELIKGLKEKGALVVSVNVGRIEPVRCDISFLTLATNNDYLVFSSHNAVCCFMWNIKESGYDLRCLGDVKIACVGDKTSKALLAYGLKSDIVSENGTSDNLSDILMTHINRNSKIFLAGPKEGGNTLEEKLGDLCDVQKLICYRNIDVSKNIDNELKHEIEKCDGAIFTSGSNVRRLGSITEVIFKKKNLSIGPQTSKALIEIGAGEYIEADYPSYEELIKLSLNI